MTHDEMIGVIMHHKNGGKVECRCKTDGAWIYKQHVDINGFDFSRYDYRAKAEPMVIFAEVSYITGQVLRTSTRLLLHENDNTIKTVRT